MDKKRLEIIITGALIIIFIFALSGSIKKINLKFKSAPHPAARPQPQQSTSAGPEVKKEQLPSPQDANLKWGRCPFSGKAYTSVNKGEVLNLKLTGIVWDEKNPQALINSRVVEEGDTIGQLIVIKIYPDRVKLGQNEKYFEIKLGK